MFTKIKSRHGETIVEVMIAVIVLVIGVLAAVRLLITSGIQNELSQERVIATNLAREGIEAMRNIRGTNWLRFSGEKRRCWNNADFVAPITCEDDNSDGVPNNVIEHDVFYIAKFDDSNYRWELEKITNPLNLSDGINLDDEKYRLRTDTGNGLLNHVPVGAGIEDTIYFRELKIEYMNDTATALSLTTPEEKANVVRITSRIEWEDRGRLNEIILTGILTDHLGRKNHD